MSAAPSLTGLVLEFGSTENQVEQQRAGMQTEKGNDVPRQRGSGRPVRVARRLMNDWAGYLTGNRKRLPDAKKIG